MEDEGGDIQAPTVLCNHLVWSPCRGPPLSLISCICNHPKPQLYHNPCVWGEMFWNTPQHWPKPYMWPDSWSQQVSMHHLMEIQMKIHPSTATSYSRTGGLGGQKYFNQLDAAACYRKKNLLQSCAMLILGGAELRMRISLAPSCKAWSRSQTTWIRYEHQTVAQPSFLNNAHFRLHAGLHLSDLILESVFA